MTPTTILIYPVWNGLLVFIDNTYLYRAIGRPTSGMPAKPLRLIGYPLNRLLQDTGWLFDTNDGVFTSNPCTWHQQPLESVRHPKYTVTLSDDRCRGTIQFKWW